MSNPQDDQTTQHAPAPQSNFEAGQQYDAAHGAQPEHAPLSAGEQQQLLATGSEPDSMEQGGEKRARPDAPSTASLPANRMKVESEIDFEDPLDVKTQLEIYMQEVRRSKTPLEDHPEDIQVLLLKLKEAHRKTSRAIVDHIEEKRGSNAAWSDRNCDNFKAAIQANAISPEGHAFLAASWQDAIRNKQAAEGMRLAQESLKRKHDDEIGSLRSELEQLKRAQSQMASQRVATTPAPTASARPIEKPMPALPTTYNLINPEDRKFTTEVVKTTYYNQYVADPYSERTHFNVTPDQKKLYVSFFQPAFEAGLSGQMSSAGVR
jgi:hypothetical protein